MPGGHWLDIDTGTPVMPSATEHFLLLGPRVGIAVGTGQIRSGADVSRSDN